MKITPLEIPDVLLIEPQVFGDDRGYFMETYKAEDLHHKLARSVDFIQDNESKSTRGVLRGLHFQTPPYDQSKLVRVISGEVLDVAVDIRVGSPSYGKSVTAILNDKNKHQLFIPRGFAHGFIVLSEEAVFAYKVDNVYEPQSEQGIRFDDKSLAIDWGVDISEIVLSDKDAVLPELETIPEFFKYGSSNHE